MNNISELTVNGSCRVNGSLSSSLIIDINEEVDIYSAIPSSGFRKVFSVVIPQGYIGVLLGRETTVYGDLNVFGGNCYSSSVTFTTSAIFACKYYGVQHTKSGSTYIDKIALVTKTKTMTNAMQVLKMGVTPDTNNIGIYPGEFSVGLTQCAVSSNDYAGAYYATLVGRILLVPFNGTYVS